MKFCTGCQQVWPLAMFAKNSKRRDGLADQCRQCGKRASRAHYVRNMEARELIGNMVPPPAAEAIARSCLETILASRSGGLLLSGEAIWVRRPAAPALAAEPSSPIGEGGAA